MDRSPEDPAPASSATRARNILGNLLLYLDLGRGVGTRRGRLARLIHNLIRRVLYRITLPNLLLRGVTF